MAGGVPMSELLGKGGGDLPYDLTEIALPPEDRGWLHRRIERRFDQMLAAGFLDEVRRLRECYPNLDPDLPSMRSVGYRQAWAYLEGETDLETFRARAIAATRQLAKRQITWLRTWQGAVRLDPARPDIRDRVLDAARVATGRSSGPDMP